MAIEKTNTYRTDSIAISSFILCHDGVELLGVEQNKFHHFYFVFSNPQLCEELRQKYLNKALVPAIDLFAKREMLLGEIKAKSQNSKGGNDGTNS